MTKEQKRLIGIEPLAKGKYQMKRLASSIICSLLPSLIIVGCGGSGDSGGGGNSDLGLRMGILQFITKHNLQDNTCLPDNCYLTLEEEEDTGTWLDQLESISNMAVLHWDRAIPWLVFDENPPPGVSRSDFYDGRIDDVLRSWINTFADHFKRMASGYLAVSILNGQRDGLQPCRLDEHQMVEVTGACPVLAPGTQIEFQYDPGSGPMTASFDLERSYANFVMYLYDKLQPDYLALMVEVNWFKEMPAPCPANWDGLVQLYHHLYDTVRPEVDPLTKVFATLTYKELLGFLYLPPADFTSQSFWVNHFLEGARDRAFEFYVQPYSNDYEPIGAWTVNMGVLDADLYSLLNSFVHMGIYDAQGSPKAGVTETWLDFLKNSKAQ